ncbi:MAG: DUF1028 domain-containing protein [Gemmatimonadota bacterium]|nr:DUF1028 domain-containing protein [Gemmatimonadota bacterium]MDH5196404.1 DUF1028 domain-containing protein [Gemmatimonadota bacterium]
MRRATLVLCLLWPVAAVAQEPVAWGDTLRFATFSIAAVDTATGEVGVAVTTRVACVGNAVPWVRAGVGAVATQAFTRVEYGPELLDLLADGVSAPEALRRATAADPGAARRQVGVVGLRGGSAQHTGDSTNAWAGHRAGPHYVTQGNLLVGPAVLDAVGTTFEASAASGRHLADRLIEALAAGQAAGGDARKGRAQSAAVVVADARPGMSRRPDGITAQINVCEHPTPVAELRRIYETISETLGFRELQQFTGSDVYQLRVMLHALGRYRPEEETIARRRDAMVYTQDLVDAVDAFRRDLGLATPDVGSPPGYVDAAFLAAVWRALEDSGKAGAVREQLRAVTQVRR